MFILPAVSFLFTSPSLTHVNRPHSIHTLNPPTHASTSTSLHVVSEEHAMEVFHLIDADDSGHICLDELSSVLQLLDINASSEEVSALAKYLDTDADGEICEDEFVDWYMDAAAIVASETNAVRSALLGRRTVNNFDMTPVPDEVLKSAVEAAIAAPNHKLTEPWRFVQLGQETISKIAELNAQDISKKDPEKGAKKKKRWESIPGWCVITCAKSDDDIQQEEDLMATACAVQNFQLSMWADGVGTKWTSGPITRTAEFADICGIDLEKEKFVGCLWYGFASGGLGSLEKGPMRRKNVDDVLSSLP